MINDPRELCIPLIVAYCVGRLFCDFIESYCRGIVVV